MLYAMVPVLVLVIGLLLWALAANAVVKEAGRLAFFVGLLWAVYPFAGHMARLL